MLICASFVCSFVLTSCCTVHTLSLIFYVVRLDSLFLIIFQQYVDYPVYAGQDYHQAFNQSLNNRIQREISNVRSWCVLFLFILNNENNDGRGFIVSSVMINLQHLQLIFISIYVPLFIIKALRIVLGVITLHVSLFYKLCYYRYYYCQRSLTRTLSYLYNDKH